MSAKDAILNRIRNATQGTAPAAPIQRNYLQQAPLSAEERLELFIEIVRDYKAKLHPVTNAQIPQAVWDACQVRGAQRLVVPEGFPEPWLPEGLTYLRDVPLSPAELDRADGVITTCALGIAQTGTIVLDGGPGQGRRALTLLPDYHLCIVQAEQVVGLVPEAIVQLKPAIEQGQPLTFISGPSATSDIELKRVEGVHGPRTLEILLVTEGTTHE